MKRFIALLCALALIALPVLAEETPTDAQRFKNEYEILNGQMNFDGSAEYQVLEIPEDNLFRYADLDSLKALFAGESAVLYLGFPECPWCRTLVPVLLEAVEQTGFEGNLYYYNALGDRDSMSLDENGEIVVEAEGTETYQYLLDAMGYCNWAYQGLDDPSIRRVYFPTVAVVKNGAIIACHIDTIEGQADGYDKLTDEQHQRLLDLLCGNISQLQ